MSENQVQVNLALIWLIMISQALCCMLHPYNRLFFFIIFLAYLVCWDNKT